MLARLDMRRSALLLVITAAVVAPAPRLNGQTTDRKASAFEVASVKVGVPADVPYGIRPVSAGGQFHAILTLHDLVQVAFGTPLALLPSQVIGGPAWVASERFEILAKARHPASRQEPDGTGRKVRSGSRV